MESSVQGPAPCKICKGAIQSTYFAQSGFLLCPGCAEILQRPPTRSRLISFLRAVLFGGATAAVCALLSFLVSYFTGLELGIVWLVFGGVIGARVHVGSDRRGGWGYGVLAIMLTYLAIGTSLTGLVALEMRKDKGANPPPQKEVSSPFEGLLPQSRMIDLHPISTPTPTPLTSPTPKASPTATPQAPPNPGAAGLVLAVLILSAMLAVMVVISPVLACWASPIAILIYGFGMHAAFKACRRVNSEISGPFQLDTPPAPSTEGEPTS